MISGYIITAADQWLDNQCGPQYKNGDGSTNLAQDLARVCKVQEELGEAVAELILFTGQNQRKSSDPGAYDRMLKELGDTALAAILAIQHFTKDANETDGILSAAQRKIYDRINYPKGVVE